MGICIIIYILCILSSSTALLVVPENQDEVKKITDCVIKFVLEWSSNEFNGIKDITTINVDDKIDLSAIHNMKRIRVVSRIFSTHIENIYNLAYIIMIEDYYELHAGLNQVTSDVFWNPKARFIIIVRNLDDDSLNKIQNLFRDYNMFTVTLISYKNDDYAIYMFNLTSNTCVKNERLVFVSWCSMYNGERKLPYLVRRLSIRHCHFKFIAHNLWPFVNFDDTGKEGIEQYSLKLFGKYTGIKINFEIYEKMDRFGNIPGNYTEDMVKKVEKNEMEGFLGGYPIGTVRRGNLSHTYPLDTDYMVHAFAHANVLGIWEAVLHRSISTCTIVTILFITFSTAAILLSIFSKRQKSAVREVLIVFGYILGKTYTENIHPGLPQRLVFISLLILAFMIPYVLQAYLYSVTYNPVRGFEPKEIEDAKTYTPVFFSEMYKYFRSVAKDCGNRLNCLAEVKDSPNKSLYTVLSQTMFNIYAWMMTDDQCQLQVYTLKHPIGTLFRTIYLRRGSILLEHLNAFLFWVESGGLIDKYLLDIYHSEWVKCKAIYHSQHKPINLKDVYSAFGILIFGYILSAIVLVFEFFFGARSVWSTLSIFN